MFRLCMEGKITVLEKSDVLHYFTRFPVQGQPRSSVDAIVNVGALLPSAGHVPGPWTTGTSRGRDLSEGTELSWTEGTVC